MFEDLKRKVEFSHEEKILVIACKYVAIGMWCCGTLFEMILTLLLVTEMPFALQHLQTM